MASRVQIDGRTLWNWLRLIGWAGAVVLLMLPLAAMQMEVPGVHWTLSDFLVMGALIGTCGLILELATRLSDNLAYRFGAAFAVAAAFLLIWINLAVGFLGDEDNPANLMFLPVIGVAIVGAVIGRARAGGMAQALVATAVAQVAAGIVAYGAGWASPGAQGVSEVVVGTALFTGLWLLSAFLFGRAAKAGA